MNLKRFVATYLPQVDAVLGDLLQQQDSSVGPFYGMMRYHLGWADASLRPCDGNPGKRLRPLLCLLSCYAAGGDHTLALPAAAALELVHNFSLVHDDIEDGSPMRRGRSAVWNVWGTAHAINVGDGLFALARLALSHLVVRGLPLARALEAARALDQACLVLCEGQFLDMSFEEQTDVDLELYLLMIRCKTAALLAASAQLGAVIATDDARTISLLRSFGENLGMAFQIRDDVLGIWGEEELTGKSTYTDLRDRKKTLPVIHALAQDLGSGDARRLAALYAHHEPLREDEIREILAVLERAHSREYADGVARHYLEVSLDCLGPLGLPAPAEKMLTELALSLVSRCK
jgi:geranylgeranyl diphosphate synthase type I